MGLTYSYLRFINISLDQAFGKGALNGLRMLELGDQVINDPNIPERTGKAYFTNRGIDHVSVDINGRHGALARDLTRPDQFIEWHGAWDIVTNSGTTEHVEPYESQYECFSIIHDCLKVGGIAIHLVPDVNERDVNGAWLDHCRFYYSDSFFQLLANACAYEVQSSRVINGLRCVAVRKTRQVPFMGQRAQFLASIAQRECRSHPKGLAGKLMRLLGVDRLLIRFNSQ